MAKYIVLATPEDALAADEWSILIADVNTLEEAPDDLEKIEHRDLLKQLRERFSVIALRTVAKIHEQFGHPSAAVLASR